MIVKALHEGWQFRSGDGEDWLPAQVPGCVHMDLLRNGSIADPFYGTNEREMQWVDKRDWEYATVFETDEEIWEASRAELVFDGLDTYADVYLNDRPILFADNMFRGWRVDVKPHLKKGANTLVVKFRSPIAEDLPKLEQLGYSLPAGNDQSEVGGLGDKRVSVFARKAPYHYGWDWGPRFVTSGIWREVRLEAWDHYRINDLYIRQDAVNAAEARLCGVVEIESEASFKGKLRLATDGLCWERDVELAAGLNVLELQAVIAEPRLWWCRGLGDPHLYRFEASFEAEGVKATSLAATVGLRSAKLIREKDAHGTTFYMELNGIPVFAKGANHIPNDSFVTEVTRERYRHEIESAARANMNMLRVWGGGIYEAEDFYELCDQYGIMVWQDFMFACSMYPGGDDFFDSIREEAAYNVRRLRNYASVVLWCGNNEIDTAWAQYNETAGWGWKKQYTAEQREQLWRDYEEIFHRLLPDAVSSHSHGIDYWPSSPMQALTGDASQHATDQSASGDIHYWGVWHGEEPFENYNVKVGRFMSEYGFQSFPEYKTVRTYAEEDDMALESEVMMAHQRNPAGNRLIKKYMDRYMKQPKDFPAFLYLSQMLQAEAMKMAFEAHRRRRGYCMGTLYWQMNDCWPVASWAGIDYYGRWKATHYFAAQSFKDRMVSIDGTDEAELRLHVLNDAAEPLHGRLEAAVYSFDGELLGRHELEVAVPAGSAEKLAAWSAKEFAGERAQSAVLVATLFVEGEAIDVKMHDFASAQEMTLRDPRIKATVEESSNGSRITLQSASLAKGVCLSAEKEGIFTDNYFDLLPGRPVTVQFLERSDGEAAFATADPGKLDVTSMYDYIIMK
ncbi:beta-mannosidase [Paenibacillus sp. J5C2022]|uniref:beta-mannosidase n=1 Tax=Paenibacillus sp. J5C2022 TaxID=2977129 RepID=UPI0021CF397D|nr:glycoside hydrolase family 2 protein [Paenibacillus sp. J5C2022]